jgi:hypothetical protein
MSAVIMRKSGTPDLRLGIQNQILKADVRAWTPAFAGLSGEKICVVATRKKETPAAKSSRRLDSQLSVLRTAWTTFLPAAISRPSPSRIWW